MVGLRRRHHGIGSRRLTFTADASARGVSYGRARAIDRPLHGATAVARFVIAVQRQAPASLTYGVADVNGRPAVLAYHDGALLSVLSLDVVDGRVREIFIIADPEKLASLGALRFAH